MGINVWEGSQRRDVWDCTSRPTSPRSEYWVYTISRKTCYLTNVTTSQDLTTVPLDVTRKTTTIETTRVLHKVWVLNQYRHLTRQLLNQQEYWTSTRTIRRFSKQHEFDCKSRIQHEPGCDDSCVCSDRPVGSISSRSGLWVFPFRVEFIYNIILVM